jgi:hypothetical protein
MAGSSGVAPADGRRTSSAMAAKIANRQSRVLARAGTLGATMKKGVRLIEANATFDSERGHNCIRWTYLHCIVPWLLVLLALGGSVTHASLRLLCFYLVCAVWMRFAVSPMRSICMLEVFCKVLAICRLPFCL